ncbi:MAG TPA: GntR family transcriptional regulator [Terriglobales bacterium]|nr:GntR family transcriptional regulator [Terriglobales bacterium]
MSLDTASGGPLYQQLRQQLFSRIRRGEFGPGDMLPSENQLCEEYGVSVTTARRALLELVKEGVVRRRMGVGTMVAPRVRQLSLGFVSIDSLGCA